MWQNTGGALIYQSQVVQYFAFSISCDALPYTGDLFMNLEENKLLNLSVNETKRPLVSVIMPCYKMGRFIGEALESVGRQTYANWEVIAVDDCGPEDGTREAVEGFAKQFPNNRVIYHRHEKNGGVSAARNTAIGMAQGEYLAFLDPDDAWDAAKLEFSVGAFTKAGDIVLAHHPVKVSQMVATDSPWADVCFQLRKESRIYRLSDEEHFLKINDICTSTVVVSKETFERVIFPVGMVFQFEDWVAWCLLGNHGRFVYQPEVLATYRFHGSSFTFRQAENDKIKSFANLEALFCIISRSNNNVMIEKIGDQIVEVLLKLVLKTAENWLLQRKPVAKVSLVNVILRAVVRKKFSNLLYLLRGRKKSL